MDFKEKYWYKRPEPKKMLKNDEFKNRIKKLSESRREYRGRDASDRKKFDKNFEDWKRFKGDKIKGIFDERELEDLYKEDIRKGDWSYPTFKRYGR